MPDSQGLTEQQKVRKLYALAGERGLYVNTNFDLFTHEPELIRLQGGSGYEIPLINPDSKVDGIKQNAYTSPLLFVTLTGLLNHGTMILTGGPGLGKTTSSELAGPMLTGTSLEDVLASEILGHPQLTEEKMIASYDLGKLVYSGEKVVIPSRFLECPVKIIDEVNRLPPDTSSILMKVADTGKAVYGGQLLIGKTGPLYATANYTDEGNFQLTPPFLDRFDVAVMVTSPAPWDLRTIRKRGDEKLNGGIEDLAKFPQELKLDLTKIRKEINSLPEETESGMSQVEEFADFVYASLRFSEAASQNLSRATKGNAWAMNQNNSPAGHFSESPHVYSVNELTIRTMKAMPRYAKAFAWFNGDNTATLTHLKKVIPYLLWHKIQPTQTAITGNPLYANDRIAFVEELVKKIETDYTEFMNHDIRKKAYLPALYAIKEGKLSTKTLTPDELRTITKNAIIKIGEVDSPWAINLANHLSSLYNTRQNLLNNGGE
jgi:MoxR-like ATPase